MFCPQTALASWAAQTSSGCPCSDCWETASRTWLWQWRRLWSAWASSAWCPTGCTLRKRCVATRSSCWPSCRKWNWTTPWSKSSVNRPPFYLRVRRVADWFVQLRLLLVFISLNFSACRSGADAHKYIHGNASSLSFHNLPTHSEPRHSC